MSRNKRKGLTFVLTAAMLLSSVSLPVSAEDVRADFGAADTQNIAVHEHDHGEAAAAESPAAVPEPAAAGLTETAAPASYTEISASPAGASGPVTEISALSAGTSESVTKTSAAPAETSEANTEAFGSTEETSKPSAETPGTTEETTGPSAEPSAPPAEASGPSAEEPGPQQQGSTVEPGANEEDKDGQQDDRQGDPEMAGDSGAKSDTAAPVITVTPKEGTNQTVFENSYYCDMPVVTVTDDSAGEITVTVNDADEQKIQSGGQIDLSGKSGSLILKARDAAGNERTQRIGIDHYPGGRYDVYVEASCTEARRRITYMICKHCGEGYGSYSSAPARQYAYVH